MGSSSNSNLPSLRWGIIGTGLISSWFVKDLTIARDDARASHTIAAIGSSSLQKGKDFVSTHIPSTSPTVYGSYDEVYAASDVDIVYIGTPHAFHKKNCLDAIRAHKHVLCEKAFTITAKEAEEVLAAAKNEGVFVMEAMWTRFTPLVLELRKRLYEDKVIGEVKRTFCDFGLDMNIAALGPESRLKNPSLGAGSLLDIGIYSLTWGLLTLDAGLGSEAEEIQVTGVQTLSDGIDTTSTVILKYPKGGKQGILTSTTDFKTPEVFCRIEGTEGFIEVEGAGASVPSSFTVKKKAVASSKGDPSANQQQDAAEDVYHMEKQGFGFYWEADAVALDIAAGRLESRIMPHAETLRVMGILDKVRRQGGARFPQDDE